jgi:hypothetical protein
LRLARTSLPHWFGPSSSISVIADGAAFDSAAPVVAVLSSVGVDDDEFLVIVRIRMLVARSERTASVWIARVVHAGPQISVREVLVLVIEAEAVSDLLTRDQPAPCGRVVGNGIEVGVVQLGRGLGPASRAPRCEELYYWSSRHRVPDSAMGLDETSRPRLSRKAEP